MEISIVLGVDARRRRDACVRSARIKEMDAGRGFVGVCTLSTKGTAAIAIPIMQKAEHIGSSEGSYHPRAPAESPAESSHNFRATTMKIHPRQTAAFREVPVKRMRRIVIELSVTSSARQAWDIAGFIWHKLHITSARR